MPRFFFHLRDHDLLHEDDEGTNLPSLCAALDEALRVRSELLGELNGRSELEFEIADDVGRTVLRIPIQERRPCWTTPLGVRVEACRRSEQIRLFH